MRFFSSVIAALGVYTAKAGNGKNEPLAVTDFALDATTATSITVSWIASERFRRQTPDINSFYVFALKDDTEPSNFDVQIDGHYQAPPTDWLTASTFTLNNLDKNTDYWLWVGAHNVDGTGPLVGPLTTTTLSTKPGPVLDVDVVDATSSSLKVTWTQNADIGGNPITEYNVYQKTTFNAPTDADSPVATVGSDVFSWTSTGLDANTAYFYWVGATNSLGETISSIADGTTLPEAADAPRNVMITAITATTLTFTWDAPAYDGGSPVTGYDIYFGTSSTQGAVRTTAVAANVFTYTFSSLIRYTDYYVFIQTTSLAGASVSSSVAMDKTDSTIPSAVSFSVAADSATQFTATWTAPSDDGGLGIDKYEVFVSQSATKPGSSTFETPAGLTYVATGLTRANLYYVWVQAVNADGPSIIASFVPVVTFSTVPTVPQNVAATATSSTVVSLVWDAPQDDGGSSVFEYDIYMSQTEDVLGSLLSTTNVDVRTYSAENLTRANTYFFTVVAVNAVGDSAASAQVSDTTDSTAPFMPHTLASTAVTVSDFSLSWSAPRDNGGETVTGYKVWVKTDDVAPLAGEVATYMTQTLGATATGLTRATNYYVWVQATNAIGGSDLSVRFIVTTPTTPPSNDVSLTAEAQGPTEIFLTWNAPSDNGGLAITAYIVRYGMSADNLMTLATVSASTFTYTHSELAYNVEYFYSVAAVNSDGNTQSAVASATTQATVPFSPALSVSGIAANSFTATWTAPFNGGEEITSYKLWIKEEESNIPTDSDTPLDLDDAVLTYTFSGLTRGTSYTVFVAAVNSIGRSVSFEGASYTIETLPEKPVAPTELVFSIERDSNQNRDVARVAFQSDPEDDAQNGGAMITSYTLYVAAKGQTDYDNPLWEKTTINVGDGGFEGKVFTLFGAEFHTKLNQIWVTSSNVAGESMRSAIYQDAGWLCYKCKECDTRCYGRTNNNLICPLTNDPFCA